MLYFSKFEARLLSFHLAELFSEEIVQYICFVLFLSPFLFNGGMSLA